jgi:RecA/RadA recombinase
MGPQLQRGTQPLEPPPHHPCGIEAIDALLGGGFPGHRISEVVGAPSSGRTSVALSLLAHTTRDVGELVAVVDRADAFDPSSAEAAGVDLDRVLWARVDEARAALRCVERLLETGGIPLVLLDLGAPALASSRSRDRGATSSSVWIRLARCAAQTRSALVVLTPERTIGAQAEVALEMQPTRPCFSGTPSLLEQLETRAVLLRHRTAPTHRTATFRLGSGHP